jgi:hypothetical protein
MPKAAEAAYAPKANPVDPLALKKEGNEHFKRGSFESAAKCYTTAIDLWSMPLPPAPSPSPFPPAPPAPPPRPLHRPRLLHLPRPLPPPPPPPPPLPLPLERGRVCLCSHSRVPRGGAMMAVEPKERAVLYVNRSAARLKQVPEPPATYYCSLPTTAY